MYQFTYLEHFSTGMVMGLQTCKWWRKSRNMSLPYRPGCRNTHSTPRAWWEVKGELILELKMEIKFFLIVVWFHFGFLLWVQIFVFWFNNRYIYNILSESVTFRYIPGMKIKTLLCNYFFMLEMIYIHWNLLNRSIRIFFFIAQILWHYF